MTARSLTRGESVAVAAVGGATALLGLLGFLNSFARVAHAAEPSFGWFSWTVPLGIDLGIAVFSALDIVLSRLDMRIRWLRLLPWSLTTATVYLNVAGEPTLFGRVAHAVLPGLWVVAVEVAAYVVKKRAGMLAGTRMDRIRASRWLFAPRTTLALWRRMVLWEVTSYPEALRRERDRLLALTDLQATYGRWAWRWRAPLRARALYRLGEHATSTGTTGAALPATCDDGMPTGSVHEPSANTTTGSVVNTPANSREHRPRTRTGGGRGRSRKPATSGPRTTRADYLAIARDAITDDMTPATVTPSWVMARTGCGRTTATSIAAELRAALAGTGTAGDGQQAA